jgi:hypothetical protein
MVAGCRTRQIAQESTRRDSIVYLEREMWNDSLIFIPGDSAWIKAYLECDSSGRVLVSQIESLKGKIITPQIKYYPEYIKLQCDVDSESVYLRWKSRYIKEINHSTDSVKEIVKEPYIPKFYRITFWFFICISGAGLFYVLLKFKPWRIL